MGKIGTPYRTIANIETILSPVEGGEEGQGQEEQEAHKGQEET